MKIGSLSRRCSYKIHSKTLQVKLQDITHHYIISLADFLGAGMGLK